MKKGPPTRREDRSFVSRGVKSERIPRAQAPPVTHADDPGPAIVATLRPLSCDAPRLPSLRRLLRSIGAARSKIVRWVLPTRRARSTQVQGDPSRPPARGGVFTSRAKASAQNV